MSVAWKDPTSYRCISYSTRRIHSEKPTAKAPEKMVGRQTRFFLFRGLTGLEGMVVWIFLLPPGRRFLHKALWWQENLDSTNITHETCTSSSTFSGRGDGGVLKHLHLNMFHLSRWRVVSILFACYVCYVGYDPNCSPYHPSIPGFPGYHHHRRHHSPACPGHTNHLHTGLLAILGLGTSLLPLYNQHCMTNSSAKIPITRRWR